MRQKIPHSPFATRLSGSAKETELRLRNIFQWNKKRPPVIVLIAAMLLAAGCGSLVGFTQAPTAEPSAPPYTEGMEAWEDGSLTGQWSFQNGAVYRRIASDAWVAWSSPVPAPASWATQDLAGRDEAETLADCEHWIGLTSSSSGWFVASVGAGVAHADTYVYRTQDAGRTWEETGRPEEAHWYPECVAFLDDTHAIIGFGVFMDAPIYRTEDGGETWIEITELPLADGIWQATSIKGEGSAVTMCLQYRDKSQAGPDVTLYSEDYGAHWSETPPNASGSGEQAPLSPEDQAWLEIVKPQHEEMERLRNFGLNPDVDTSQPRWFSRAELEAVGYQLSDGLDGLTCYEMKNAPSSMEELLNQAYNQFEPELAEQICDCARWGDPLCFFAEGKMWHRDRYGTVWYQYDWDTFFVVSSGEDFVIYTLEGYSNANNTGSTPDRKTWMFMLQRDDIGGGVKLWRYADLGMEVDSEPMAQ